MFKLFQHLHHRVELKDKCNSNKADSFTQWNMIYGITWIRSDPVCGKRRCILN